MFLYIALFTVLTVFDFQANSQNQNSAQLTIEEINNQLFIYNNETEEVLKVAKTEAVADSLINSSNELRGSDTRGSFLAARQALVISRDLGYRDGLARAHNLLGINHFDFGDYEQALTHYFAAMEIEEELGNEDRIASLLNNFALVYAEQGDYEMTANYLMESIDKRKSIGQTSQVFTATNNLGVLYRRQGEYDKALEYFFAAAEGALTAEPDSNLHMITTLNIGNTYRNKGEFETALPYLEKATEYFEKNDQTLNLAYVNLFLGSLYRDKMELDPALDYTLKAIRLAETEMHRERLKDAHQLASEIYELNGDFKNAFTHFQTYHQISDTLLNNERLQRINELQIRYEVSQKDQEIELLNRESALREAELSQQELYRNFLIAFIIFLGIITLLLIYTNRIKKKNNLTLKKSREEIEEQNKKLFALNKEKDEFLSLAVHDLRSPLSSVMMIADIIKNGGDVSKDELDEYTNLIHVSTQKMLHLVNNLLDIQNEKTQFENEEINIIRVLKNSIENFEKPAKQKNIKLDSEITDEEILIDGNSNYLMRIFDNLISNSIKYSPPGSKVKIFTEHKVNKVRITFKDEGPGISKEEQENLFRQFGTTSNEPTGNESSTGLGLYIVKKFTTAMNGRVWVESEPGKGSAFIIEIAVHGSEPSSSVSKSMLAKN